MRICDKVMEWIKAKEVNDVFLLTGGGAMYLNDALIDSGLNVVCMQHEQTMAMAVEAYAKANNYYGVGIFTSGPGSTNAVTGVAGAWLDSVPCLFISGTAGRDISLHGCRGKARQIGVQEINIVDIVKPITKYAIVIYNPKDVLFHLNVAFKLSHEGRPGPSWLDIPLDVQKADYRW